MDVDQKEASRSLVKARAETKPEMRQVGVGKEAQPLSTCVTLAVVGSEAVPCGRKCEQMFFFDGDSVSGGVGGVCKFSREHWC